jgi:hypothetical protein
VNLIIVSLYGPTPLSFSYGRGEMTRGAISRRMKFVGKINADIRDIYHVAMMSQAIEQIVCSHIYVPSGHFWREECHQGNYMEVW